MAVIPDGLTPAEARLLWLAARLNSAQTIQTLVAAEVGPGAPALEALKRWRHNGWADVYVDGRGGWRWELTAAGRLVTDTVTPADLHHAGACLPGCPLCEESA